MSTTKHIEEHSALGLPWNNGKNIRHVSNKTEIAAALATITENLVATTLAGTVSVINASPTITFSVAPGNNNVVADRSLFTVDGLRFYRIKSGPSLANGLIFTLFENYVGSTNATSAFTIYEPNPHTIILAPGVYDYTADALAQNITLKPYVSLSAIDRSSTIIRRNRANPTPATTPLIAMFHGCELSNFTIDTVDGHFNNYRMGLSALATSQTQAMKGSRWILRSIAMLNKDPNGIDTGSDYNIDTSYYNSDELVFEDCFFEHCWDGFTWNTAGAGRLNVKFFRPKIWKLPFPDSLSQSGATFIRSGVTGTSTADIVMQAPFYDQITYAAGEVVDDGLGGIIANSIGTSGVCVVGNGATMKIYDPVVDIDYGLNYGRCSAFAVIGTANSGAMTIIGGKLNVLGAGAAGSSIAAVQTISAASVEIDGTKIIAGHTAIKSNHASSVIDVRNSHCKGTTNSVNNVAGTVNIEHGNELDGNVTGTLSSTVRGIITLNGATPVTVTTTKVHTNSRIQLSRHTIVGTPASFGVDTKTNNVSFTIIGTALDTSTVVWELAD